MIDILWNDLIYFKFKDQIKIDKMNYCKNWSAALKDKKEYLLSEIILKRVNQNLDELIKKIKSSINEMDLKILQIFIAFRILQNLEVNRLGRWNKFIKYD